ncbi:MAG: undecaprenyl-diphosphate phosphatase [Candidatus Saccharimonadales bacterium]
MIELLQAVLLGLLQGLTEFIPVSSSAHLIIAEEGVDANFGGLAYDVVLHLGTLTALLIYFRAELITLGRAVFHPGASRKLLGYLVIATLPAAIVGFFASDLIESALRSLWVIVVMLVVGALVMFLVDRRRGSRELGELRLRDAVIIGFSQALALIPGTSRAGATLVAGSWLGFNNAEAARFSFLMAVPILLGANLRVLSSSDVLSELSAELPYYILGFLVAAASAYFVIRFLLDYLSTHKLAVFAWYRLILAGALVLILVI